MDQGKRRRALTGPAAFLVLFCRLGASYGRPGPAFRHSSVTTGRNPVAMT